MQALYIERVGSKAEDRAHLLTQILDRQIRVEGGKGNPILIFPEGCTTNGNGGLLQFKKGAFASLRPVQPICLKYWSLRSRVGHGDPS